MSFLRKLFGKGTAPAPRPAEDVARQAKPVADPRSDPNMIRVFDKFGRELFITKQEWRVNVLPGAIRAQWNQPEGLYGVILGAVNDGFSEDVLEAAAQLHRIDPIPVRATCIYAIVLTKTGQLDRAEQLLQAFLDQHGPEGVVLTNLAKVHAARGSEQAAEATLWQGLVADPNQDNAVGWFEVMHRERSGSQAGQEALERIAALPRSWRARLWLARAALKSKDLASALSCYETALDNALPEVPADLLMQMSGDLGNAGHLDELLKLAEPLFSVNQHGLQVGNNLIKANIDLGRLDKARGIVDALYALKRPDWNETLSYWDTQIAQARLQDPPQSLTAPMETTLLSTQAPLWLNPAWPAAALFPSKSADAPKIAFLGSTAEQSSMPDRIVRQLTDAPGRLSRGLPLFLAEQAALHTTASAHCLTPWIASGGSGFVLMGAPWSDADVLGFAEGCELLVMSHVVVGEPQWKVVLRLLRPADGEVLGVESMSFDMSEPDDAIAALARSMLSRLTQVSGIRPSAAPAGYVPPARPSLATYLVRLEQLLATKCAGQAGTPSLFLSGERDIMQGAIALCLDSPGNVAARLLLAASTDAMNKARPSVVEEFAERITLVGKEHPLPSACNDLVEQSLGVAMGR